MNKLARLLVVPVITLFTLSAQAEEGSSEAIEKALSAVIPANQILGISESPIPGLMEVQLRGGKLLYTSPDGEYVIDGSLFQLTDSGIVNVQQQRLDELMKPKRLEAIKNLKDADMVTFKAHGDTKATIYAFTDVDCGYCRKLHSEMASYQDKGIEIHYLAYPRAGVGSSSYDKMVSVWCADDPQKAMTLAKAGKPIAHKTCDNPVAEEFALGSELGVTGTPSLMTTDGQLLPGYMPADRLAQVLGIN